MAPSHWSAAIHESLPCCLVHHRPRDLASSNMRVVLSAACGWLAGAGCCCCWRILAGADCMWRGSMITSGNMSMLRETVKLGCQKVQLMPEARHAQVCKIRLPG